MSMQTKDRPGLSWKKVCEDPNLQDLPYKVETNDRGQIVMSPTYARHGRFAYQIAQRLEELLPEGVSSVETAVRTAKGTKVADAIWCTAERWEKIKDAYDVPVAPEICVEVRSPTNTDAEIDEKRQLYLEAGAEEVWICDGGDISRFTTRRGRLNPLVGCPHSQGSSTCRHAFSRASSLVSPACSRQTRR